MSSHASLDAAAHDRKARLAQLKSLKRKQPDSYSDVDASAPPSKLAKSPSPTLDVTTTYLSGRNYDPTTRGPKLGFESAPSEEQETLESQAARLAVETRQEAEEEEKADKPLDLFKLQPKKPNWDLKRDLQRKMEVVNVRTENAIARLVRERIEAAQNARGDKGMKDAGRQGGKDGDAEGEGDGEAAGLDGVTLVEAMHLREREEEEERRREVEAEREEDEDEDEDMGVS